MAFNLNKNDAPDGSSTSNTKFELSKNSAVADGTAASQPKKNNSLGYLLFGFLLLVGLTWYLLSDESAPIQKEAIIARTADPVNTLSETETNTAPVNHNAKADLKIPVSFATGATTINTVDESVVNEILKSLSDHPDLTVEVLGYASSEGAAVINQSISQGRADAFKNYLISRSISAKRITAKGMGTENPIASNDTEMGRNKNRRVEVRLQ